MGWVEDLNGETVGLDTAPLIYYIEQNQDYVDIVRPFFQAVERGEIEVVTSTATLLEVLVHPLKQGDVKLAHEYNDVLLSSPHIEMVPVTPTTSQAAAELRASSRLETPDAIHMATAMNHRADAFLTGDRDFKNAGSIPVLKVADLKP